MASCNLYRQISTRSEFATSVTRRLISTNNHLFQAHQPETNESTPKEKIQNHQIADEENKPKTEEIEESESDDDGLVNKTTGEVGGPKGPEPTRYGDWEKGGRCCDF